MIVRTEVDPSGGATQSFDLSVNERDAVRWSITLAITGTTTGTVEVQGRNSESDAVWQTLDLGSATITASTPVSFYMSWFPFKYGRIHFTNLSGDTFWIDGHTKDYDGS